MVGRVEYDQLVKYIMTWPCYSSVPQSMARQCELQKQTLGLVCNYGIFGYVFYVRVAWVVT